MQHEVIQARAVQAQDHGSYGTQYQAEAFSLPSTSMRKEQEEQVPVQARQTPLSSPHNLVIVKLVALLWIIS